MTYLLEMRSYSYLWRDPNTLSQPIYSSFPIPKWSVYVYLHPYAKLVPRGYSFDLEKEFLEISWLGLGLPLKESLSTSRL